MKKLIFLCSALFIMVASATVFVLTNKISQTESQSMMLDANVEALSNDEYGFAPEWYVIEDPSYYICTPGGEDQCPSIYA